MYVSSAMVFERAELFPTPEDYLPAVPGAALGVRLLEARPARCYCRAAHDEHGLPYTICRPFNAYGPGEAPDARAGDRAPGARPDRQGARRGSGRCEIFGSGEQTRTLTHVDDVADGDRGGDELTGGR